MLPSSQAFVETKWHHGGRAPRMPGTWQEQLLIVYQSKAQLLPLEAG